jgi:hypothetical protein
VGLPRTPSYRTGWLVFDGGAVWFVFRAHLASRRVPVPPVRAVELRPGPMVDTLRATSEQRVFTVFLLKDGPPAAHAAAELAPGG